ELLKQPQYVPLHVTRQVILIFTATAKEGFIDHLSTDVLGRYETELFAWLESQKADLMTELESDITKSALKKDADPLRQKLVDALNEFKNLFQA
ncbi:MAG TPA: F0F1 ATP synthase subunit alpha, partial [Myxococcales bacterium]|nr:F0F1 ATP synthase subunit alpha [Myxococcales bacterium]